MRLAYTVIRIFYRFQRILWSARLLRLKGHFYVEREMTQASIELAGMGAIAMVTGMANGFFYEGKDPRSAMLIVAIKW